MACDLLTRPYVQGRIAELVAEKTQKLDIGVDRTLKEIGLLAFSNSLDYMRVNEEGQADVDLSNMTREQAAAIEEITVDATGGTGDGERRRVLRTRLKIAKKSDALTLLAKYHKLLTEVVKHEGLQGLADLVRARRKQAGT